MTENKTRESENEVSGTASTSVPKRRRSLAYLVSVFAGGNLSAAFLRILGSLLTARFVDPSVLGLFNTVGLSQGYAQFFVLGMPMGLNRDLAYYIGREDKNAVRRLASAGFGFLLTTAALAGSATLVFGAWAVLKSGQSALAPVWMTFAAVAFFTVLQTFFLSIYRVHDAFVHLAGVQILHAACGLAMVVFVFWFGLYGLCIRTLVPIVLMAALLWRWLPLKIQPTWDWSATKELLQTGLPIWGASQLNILWDLVNSTLLVALLGTTEFGYYAIARIFSQTLTTFPQALQKVLQPRVISDFGRNPDVGNSFRQARRAVVMTVGLFLPIAAVGWFCLPIAVDFLLPKYQPGVRAAQWMIPLIAVGILRPPIAILAAIVKKQSSNIIPIITGMATYLAVLGWLTQDQVYLAAFPQAFAIGRAVDISLGYFLSSRVVAMESRKPQSVETEG